MASSSQSNKISNSTLALAAVGAGIALGVAATFVIRRRRAEAKKPKVLLSYSIIASCATDTDHTVMDDGYAYDGR